MKKPELLPFPNPDALVEHHALMERVKAEMDRLTGIDADTLSYRADAPSGVLLLMRMSEVERFYMKCVRHMLAARNGPPPPPMYPNWDDPVC